MPYLCVCTLCGTCRKSLPELRTWKWWMRRLRGKLSKPWTISRWDSGTSVCIRYDHLCIPPPCVYELPLFLTRSPSPVSLPPCLGLSLSLSLALSLSRLLSLPPSFLLSLPLPRSPSPHTFSSAIWLQASHQPGLGHMVQRGRSQLFSSVVSPMVLPLQSCFSFSLISMWGIVNNAGASRYCC